MLIFVLFLLASACHPECVAVCDSPVKPAICGPLCKPPACVAICQGTDPYECSPTRCNVVCPDDQCEADSCPACETLCDKPSCYPWGRNCSVFCEETQCSWHCRKPDGKPNVTCEWQCEAPACAALPQDIPTPAPSPPGSRLGLVLALTLGPAIALVIFARIRYTQKRARSASL